MTTPDHGFFLDQHLKTLNLLVRLGLELSIQTQQGSYAKVVLTDLDLDLEPTFGGHAPAWGSWSCVRSLSTLPLMKAYPRRTPTSKCIIWVSQLDQENSGTSRANAVTCTPAAQLNEMIRS